MSDKIYYVNSLLTRGAFPESRGADRESPPSPARRPRPAEMHRGNGTIRGLVSGAIWRDTGELGVEFPTAELFEQGFEAADDLVA